MNQGARDANRESAEAAASTKADRQIALLLEIRNLLRELIRTNKLAGSG